MFGNPVRGERNNRLQLELDLERTCTNYNLLILSEEVLGDCLPSPTDRSAKESSKGTTK
jgi:hypothetical protein